MATKKFLKELGTDIANTKLEFSTNLKLDEANAYCKWLL